MRRIPPTIWDSVAAENACHLKGLHSIADPESSQHALEIFRGDPKQCSEPHPKHSPLSPGVDCCCKHSHQSLKGADLSISRLIGTFRMLIFVNGQLVLKRLLSRLVARCGIGRSATHPATRCLRCLVDQPDWRECDGFHRTMPKKAANWQACLERPLKDCISCAAFAAEPWPKSRFVEEIVQHR